MSKANLVVVWRVSEACGLGCRFCGYSQVLDRPRRTADVDAVLAFGRVLGDFQRHSGRSVLVSWLGGEPLQWQPLPSISRVFRREYGLRLGVTTNGLPLGSATIRKLLLADYDQLTISVDGSAEFHDAVRDAPGLHDRIYANLSRLRAEGADDVIKLRVNTVLMRGNVEAFPAFCEEMARWGFRELTFNQLGGNDRPEFYPANRLLPAQVERFRRGLPELARRMAGRGLRICAPAMYLERIARTTCGKRWPISDCQPGERFLFIDEGGRASPCSFTCDGYGVPLAEIDSRRALEALPERFARRQSEQRLPACDDCHATHVFDKFDEWLPERIHG